MEQEMIRHLAVALGIGLLIGLERGWQSRDAEIGVRSLGLRSFGLAGLLGGVVGVLSESFGPWVLGFGFAGLAGFVALVYLEGSRASGDRGATTEIALLVTFALGALAAAGHEIEAAGAAVVTALLLGAKTPLHAFVARLDERELMATLQLLLAALVLLPLLPDRGMGPWEAVNPRSVGLLALLIAGLSFAGYVAVRWLGGERGTLVTALLGGLTSSTAVTVAFARAARATPERATLLGAGVGLASSMMALRVAVVVSLVAPEVGRELALPLTALALTPVLAAFVAVAHGNSLGDGTALPLRNPLELQAALGWAALLALLSLLTRALHVWLGSAGLFALAAVSGLADVDAIGLSLARMVPESLDAETAARAIALAALANTLAKGALSALLGGRALAFRGGAILLATFVAGALASLLHWAR
jgi:uncharacterized membrane protein (DUF4010 family)